jgi:hypothetical protein
MKQKNSLLFISLIFFSAFIFVAQAFAVEFHTTQDISGVYYHVDGKTDRSFYPTNQADYHYEGSVDFKEKLKDYELFGSINYRSTDDRLVDHQSWSIERMYMGLKGMNKEFLMGDFYSNFSEYSLGNALKGFKVSVGDEKSSRLIVVGGIDTAKWEDLWEQRQEDSASRRFIGGARLENKLLSDKLSLNFNYGYGRDDPSYIAATANPMLINVFSVDGKYTLNNHLAFFSKIAQSYTDENTHDEEFKTKSDRAIKVGADLNFRDYTLTSVYSRVGNHFNTTGGFAAQDLETMNFDGILFLPKKVKLIHYLHMDKDNISKTKSTTTKQLNPGGKFSFNLP